jgi:hypothetical protein
MKIKEYMKKNVVSIPVITTIGEAAAVILWKIVAAIFHNQDGYMILG